MDLVTSYIRKIKQKKILCILRCLECKRAEKYSFLILFNIQRSDDVCYLGCTHVGYLDKKEAALGKIFSFTWLCKSSFKSLASQHITGNIFLSKDKPRKRGVDLSGYRCSNYGFAKTCCDREGICSEPGGLLIKLQCSSAVSQKPDLPMPTLLSSVALLLKEKCLLYTLGFRN